MIVWLLIFGVVLAVSYLLALRSMRDFQEIPGEDEGYGLFLIRKPQELNVEVLKLLYNNFLKSGQVISFERLFKGDRSALVIFGPIRLTAVLKNLDLLELEDYTDVSVEQVLAWEMAVKDKRSLIPANLFSAFPPIGQSEHFWWQLMLSHSFKPQIRAVVVSSDPQKRKAVSDLIENLSRDNLIRLPKGYSNAQLLEFYQQRSFKKHSGNPTISPEEVLGLLKI